MELPALLESDPLRRDTYLGSADSDGVEYENKFFTDSKRGRNRKEKFRYWIGVRNPLPKPRSEWAQVTQLLPYWQPALGTRTTFVPDVAPGWFLELPGARAPISFLGEAATVIGTQNCGDLWILRALYRYQDFLYISAKTQEKRTLTMTVQVPVGAMRNFSSPIVAVWFVLHNSSSIMGKIYLQPHAFERTIFEFILCWNIKRKKLLPLNLLTLLSLVNR